MAEAGARVKAGLPLRFFPQANSHPMPSASLRILLDFFEHHLQFTPTAGQIDRFERDLHRVSPDLMAAALKEAAANRGLIGRSFDAQRAAILTIYYRKVAEHAQLFPIFHTFETAFRSTVAVELESHYARAAWWRPVRTALLRGDPARSVAHLHGVNLSKDAAHLIGQIIYSIEGDSFQRSQLGSVEDGYAFTELCDLSHIGELIAQHWSVFSPRYFRPGKTMTLQEFTGKFRTVREARNQVYHHRSVAQMRSIVVAAEHLLDRLGCSLSFSYKKITVARTSQPQFTALATNQNNLF